MNGEIKFYLPEVKEKVKQKEKELENVLQVSQKKSKGCYYTPNFIVKYITEQAISQTLLIRINELKNGLNLNSIQKLRKNKNGSIHSLLLEEVLPNFTVCDISMGWGVFLLHAFDFLFSIYKEANMVLERDFDEKIISICQNIIRCNLFGMDLSEVSIELAQLKFAEKIGGYINEEIYSLPHFNFHSGNSLLNRFSERNFDVIIGNPPYINVKKLPIKERQVYSSTYQTYNSNGDISNVFWERSLQLCKNNGLISLITPRYWLEGNDSNRLRRYLLDNSTICEVIDFRSNRSLFYITENKLGVDTAIVSIRKGELKESKINIYLSVDNKPITKINKKNLRHLTIDQSGLTEKRWNFEKSSIIDYLEENSDFRLGDDKKYNTFSGVCKIGKGSSTGNNKIFRIKQLTDDIFEGFNGNKVKIDESEKRVLKLLIKNSDISRYYLKPRNEFWIFLKDQEIDEFPNVKRYLNNFREALNRVQNKYQTKTYYDYAAYRSLDLMNSRPKIITPYQATHNKFVLIPETVPSSINETDVITLVLKDEFKKEVEWYYLLSVLNSDLIHYYAQKMNKKVYNLLDFRSNQIANFPIIKCENSFIYRTLVGALIDLKRQNKQSETHKYDLSLITTLLNNLIFELYFRDRLSSTLHETITDFFDSLNLKKSTQVFHSCKELSKQPSTKNNIAEISNLSEIQQIRKEISS